jgi:hypothetical protein
VRVAFIGNLGPDSAPHSTENHVARALETNGVTVERIHEGRFDWTTGWAVDVDLVLWTHTHGFAPPPTHPHQLRFLGTLKNYGVPTVAIHLDRWFDLQREHQIHGEPYFRCDLVCTADGGNDDRWAAAGVNHHWFPPGVSAPECEPGTYRAELASDIAFVGSHFGGYHRESTHRSRLIRWLRDAYGDRCRFWPAPGEHALRGETLRDLYASVKVLVGDSCFSGDPRGHSYCSDRIPETIGRGGLLVHPDTLGVTDGGLYTSGEDLLTWPAYDWDALRSTIDGALADDDLRAQVSADGRAHVLKRHTYERRMADLLATLTDRGLVKQVAA